MRVTIDTEYLAAPLVWLWQSRGAWFAAGVVSGILGFVAIIAFSMTTFSLF